MEKKNLTKTVVGFGITAAAFALTPNATALAAEVPPTGDANDEVVAVTTTMQEEKVNDKLIDPSASVVEDIQSTDHQTSLPGSELEDLTESSNDVTEGIEESNGESTDTPLVDTEVPTDSSDEAIEDTLEKNVDGTEETVSKKALLAEGDQTVEEKENENNVTDVQDNSTSMSEAPKAEEKKDPLSNISSKQDFASYLLNLAQTNTATGLKENTKADVLAIFDKYFKDYADFERYLNTKDEFNPDGSLTDATQERVLTMLNFIRELNGLDPVTLNKGNSTTAQKGLEFLNKNDLMIDHNAAAGKDDVAHDGLNNSNLALAFSGNSVKELLGFFLDNDSSHNWNNAGHRHWLLSPELKSIGVASVVATGKYKGTQYFAIYIGDYHYGAPHPDHVFYPGNGLFPTEILDTDFNLPHSIMLGGKYLNNMNTIPNYRDLDITITLGNGQTLKLPFGEEGKVDCYNVGVEVLGGGRSTIILKFSDEIWKLIKQYGYTVTIKGLTIDGKPVDPLVLSAKYFSLKDAYNERANAKDVITGINDLKDPSQVTLEDKDTIINLYQKYQNLTDDQKQYISAEQTQKLTDAYNKIQELIQAQEENQKAADAVSEKINGIGEVTLDSEQAITDARTAYDALTDDQKALVSSETLKKLDDAEKRLTELKEEQRLNQEAADRVSGLINALPENITLENKSAVEAAKQAYDNLTEAQKALVSDIAVQKLNVAQAEIERLEKIESDKAAAQTVIDKITTLPEQITLDDEQAIIDAETALNALTADQKGYIDSKLITKLTDARNTFEILKLQQMEDQAAAQKVTDLVANYDGKELTIEDVAGVEQLLNMYEALTPEQKAYLTSETVNKIGSLETKINEIKEAHAHDVEMAQNVRDLINAIPDTVTLDSEEAILAAQSAYNNLTETQKSLIPGEALSKLNNAQERLTILKAEKVDKEAAQVAIDAITALPSDITTQDRAAIEAARAAYDALTETQKQYVPQETLEKLSKAESDLAIAVDKEAAQVAIDAITALPSDITTQDRAAIEAARAAYDALTETQKQYVPQETLEKLSKAESDLAVAVDKEAAQVAIDAITALPSDITTQDRAAIEAARAAYDALTETQKQYVPQETLEKLSKAESDLAIAVDREAAQAVTDAITALPDEVTLADKDAIKRAKDAYDALTDTQKQYISKESLSKLEKAESDLQVLVDKEAAQTVIDKITALPNEVTLADKDAIKQAKDAYDALTDAQKQYISQETLEKLSKAESDLQVLVDQDAAQKVIDQIANLPSRVTGENRQQFVDAINAYNALSDAQKKMIPEDRYAQLILAQSKLEKFDQTNNPSVAPPAGDIVVDGDTVYKVDSNNNVLDERSISGNPNTGGDYQDGLLAAVLALTGLGGAMFIGKKRRNSKES